jgi:hypothetical protein
MGVDVSEGAHRVTRHMAYPGAAHEVLTGWHRGLVAESTVGHGIKTAEFNSIGGLVTLPLN